jgi:lysophospholipase L1-like esterase
MAAGFTPQMEFEPDVLRRLAVEAPGPAGATRVVFLGSSQTWGAGATRRADTFVACLGRMLEARRAPDAAPIKAINAGVVGYTTTTMAARYIAEISLLRPDVTVVDMGNNDPDAPQLGRQLDALAAFNEARGIRTVFILEANTLEGSPSDQPEDWGRLHRNHRAMRDVAARRGIAVIDLHHALLEHQDEGFIWWDKVHLTSFGNALAADLLYPAIEREVRQGTRGHPL